MIVAMAQQTAASAGEDLTTYTEVDPNSRFGVTADTIMITDLQRDEDAYVYDDKGANAIDQFEHQVEVNLTSADDNGTIFGWAISNVVEDGRYWQSNSSQAVDVRLQKVAGTYRIGFYDADVGSYDYTESVSVGTTYYLTIDRQADTTIRCRIYGDSDRTSLVDTLTITCASGRKWRYLFAVNSYNSNPTYGGDKASGTVANLAVVS